MVNSDVLKKKKKNKTQHKPRTTPLTNTFHTLILIVKYY